MIKEKLKWIDLEKKQITFSSNTQRIDFDKILLACGSNKQRLKKEYSNVFYMEDSQSHARIHNELLRAKQVVILGSTWDAY